MIKPRPALLLALSAIPLLTIPQSPERLLVVVNGERITGANYYKRMETLPGVGAMVAGQFRPAAPGFLALQRLMDETLMLQLARQKGVFPTDAQVDAELRARLADNPDFVRAFDMLGFSDADVRYDLRVQLAEFNLTTMGVNIADAQVNRYYQDQIKDFTLPKRYRLRIVAVTTPEAKAKVDADIAAGKAFADIARQHSQDVATRANGGLMGDIPEASLGANIRPLVTGLRAGQTTPWLTGATGTEMRIFLESILEQRVLPLDDKLRAQIRRDLMIQRGSVRNNLPRLMEEARKSARIEWQGTPFDNQLKEIFGPVTASN